MATEPTPRDPAVPAAGPASDADRQAAEGAVRAAERDRSRTPEEIESEIERNRAAMAATIDEIQRRLSPNELMGQAFDYLRSGPGEFGANFARAVKTNPLPVSLVGLGLAWLAFAGSSGRGGGGSPAPGPTYLPPSQTYPGAGAEPRYLASDTGAGAASAADRAGSTAMRSEFSPERGGQGWRSESARMPRQYRRKRAQGGLLGAAASRLWRRAGDTGQRVSHVTASAGEHVRSIADDIRNLASEWRESAGRSAQSVSHRAADYASSATERAHGATSYVSSAAERARSATASLRSQAYEMGSTMQHQMQSTRDSMNSMLRQQPLIVGALGLAVGAVIGALLPSTRREDELMGETSDRLFDQATEMGQQALEDASDVAGKAAGAAAQAASEAAREEAERRGYAGEGAGGGAGQGGQGQSQGGPSRARESDGGANPTDPNRLATRGF